MTERRQCQERALWFLRLIDPYVSRLESGKGTDGDGAFLRGGWAPECEQEGLIHLTNRVRSDDKGNAFGELCGEAPNESVVPEMEGLRRHIGIAPFDAVRVHLGEIEYFEKR